MELPRYTVDGSEESWTLTEILQANEPSAFSEDDIQQINALTAGSAIRFGGGAAAEFVIERIK